MVSWFNTAITLEAFVSLKDATHVAWLGRVHDPAFLLLVPNQTIFFSFTYLIEMFLSSRIKKTFFSFRPREFWHSNWHILHPQTTRVREGHTCASISEHCSLYEDSQAQVFFLLLLF